ncbi:MAG: HAD family hydrolase [Chloroflexota bacterium]|nr:HAD family hydrolase [Chloroflexota bacterium]
MNRDIEAIFFDIGDTLRVTVPDERLKSNATRELMALVGTKESADVFCGRLAERYRAYCQWRQRTLIEASEQELWTRWMLPDLPHERIEPIAEQLTHLWRMRGGRAALRPDAPRVIAELSRRGYRLGIISNTICVHETPEMLEETGLARFFSAVVLSAAGGRRKPDPAPFVEATQRMGVRPARSAYVGDRPSRDVAGPRRAGFGMIILIEGSSHAAEEANDASLKPDVTIRNLSALLEIFLPRQVPNPLTD